jgi:hypothetical protein
MSKTQIVTGGLDQTGSFDFTSGVTLGDNLLFDASSKGVYLGVTSATAANLLDDYEEGTYTGTINDSSGASGSQTAVGHYVKIGNHVTVHGQVSFGGATSGSSNTFITLPFTVKSDARGGICVGLVTGGAIALTSDDKTLHLVAELNSSLIYLVETDFSGTHTHLTFDSHYGSGGIFSYSGSYITN